MAVDDVLQRGGDEKILLTQAQFAAGRRFVAWIEKFRDRLRPRHLGHRAKVIAAVEGVEAHRIDRACGPQPQRIDVTAAPADDRRVIGDRLNGLIGIQRVCGGLPACSMFEMSAIMDIEHHIAAFEFPRVSGEQPLFGKLLLPSV